MIAQPTTADGITTKPAADRLLITRMLVPVDFSPLSLAAIHAALALAHRNADSTITLVHVVEPSVPDEEGGPCMGLSEAVRRAELQLEQLLLRFGTDFNLTTRVVTGRPSRVICQMVRDSQFDLVVLSSHGRAGLERLLLGSVAESVVHDAPCPVMVVKPVKDASGHFHCPVIPVRLDHILVGYDHRAASDLALGLAARIAERHNSDVTLVHALPPAPTTVAINLLADPAAEAAAVNEALLDLNTVRAAHQPQSAHWEARATIGHPWDVITDLARESHCDLIVVGPHEHTRWGHDFMGSTAQRVMRLAPCSVLVVK